MSKANQMKIARDCLGDGRKLIEKKILEAIQADPERPKNVSRIELMIRTTHNEFYVKRFDSIHKTMQYLTSLIEDIEDLKGKL